MMTKTARALRTFFGFPRGVDVRRVVAWITLAIGVPRTEPFNELGRFLPLRFAEPEAYGVIFTALGILLLLTCYWRRLGLPGRLVAVASFGAYVTIGIDAIPLSATSVLVDFIMAYALFGEIITHAD